jgi:hypothetical protein
VKRPARYNDPGTIIGFSRTPGSYGSDNKQNE